MQFAVAPAFLFFAAVPLDARAAVAADWIARVEHAVAQELQSGFTGAVLVARGDRVVVDAEYPARDDVRTSVDSRFILSSTAKQFVAAALLKCQERQLLSLDDPISRFFPQAPALLAAVTVRQLLTHSSGLPQGYASEEAGSRDEAVRLILSQAPTAQPGTQFQYSNENYQLAAAIVEIATRAEYAAFLERELLRPAGLRDTGRITAANAALLAPLAGDLPPRLLRSTWGMQGYYSTAHDLYTWYRALRTGVVLQAGSVVQLFAPSVKIKEGQAALGWFVGKTDGGATRLFTRGNDDFGANSLIYIYPETDTILVVLSHAGDNDRDVSWSRSMLASIETALFSAASP